MIKSHREIDDETGRRIRRQTKEWRYDERLFVTQPRMGSSGFIVNGGGGVGGGGGRGGGGRAVALQSLQSNEIRFQHQRNHVNDID